MVDNLNAAVAKLTIASKVISVHPKTEDPDSLWASIAKNYKKKQIESLPLDAPLTENKVNLVFWNIH